MSQIPDNFVSYTGGYTDPGTGSTYGAVVRYPQPVPDIPQSIIPDATIGTKLIRPQMPQVASSFDWHLNMLAQAASKHAEAQLGINVPVSGQNYSQPSGYGYYPGGGLMSTQPVVSQPAFPQPPNPFLNNRPFVQPIPAQPAPITGQPTSQSPAGWPGGGQTFVRQPIAPVQQPAEFGFRGEQITSQE